MEKINCEPLVDICELIPIEKYVPIRIKGTQAQKHRFIQQYGFIIDGKAYIPDGNILLIYNQGEYLV